MTKTKKKLVLHELNVTQKRFMGYEQPEMHPNIYDSEGHISISSKQSTSQLIQNKALSEAEPNFSYNFFNLNFYFELNFE